MGGYYYEIIKLYVVQAFIFGSMMTLFQIINQRDELLRYFVGITMSYFVFSVIFDLLRKKLRKDKK